MTEKQIQEIMALVDGYAESSYHDGYAQRRFKYHKNTLEERAAIESALREQVPEHCAICGSDEPFSGTCGGGRLNPSALCYQRVHGKSSVVPQPAQVPYQKLQNDELPGMWDQSDFLGGETDCAQPAQAEQPKAQREPMTLDQIHQGWSTVPIQHPMGIGMFRQGVFYAERFHGITKDGE